ARHLVHRRRREPRIHRDADGKAPTPRPPPARSRARPAVPALGAAPARGRPPEPPATPTPTAAKTALADLHRTAPAAADPNQLPIASHLRNKPASEPVPAATTRRHSPDADIVQA